MFPARPTTAITATSSSLRGRCSQPLAGWGRNRPREEECEGSRARARARAGIRLRARAASRSGVSSSSSSSSSSSPSFRSSLSLSLPERTTGFGSSSASKLRAVSAVGGVGVGATQGWWAVLWSNPVFKTGFLAWVAAQVLKVVTSYISTRSLDWRPLFDSGGMPSSHSSLCMGVTTAVAVLHGLGSSVFAICLGFSCIVMYDAANVRLQAGKHAQILNAIVKTERGKGLELDLGLKDLQLKEVLGHSKIQVMCGAVLGVIIGLVVG